MAAPLLSTRPMLSLHGRWRSEAGYREVLVLAGPLILSTSTMTVQQFINRMFLSWYSPDALAASLPSGILAFTMLCLFVGTVSYANTFVAQYQGAGQPHRIAASVWQAIYLSLAAGVLVIPLALLGRPLFALSGHPPEVTRLEVIYFQILVCGGGFAILSSAASAFFTGRGLTRTVMAVNIITALLNVALDAVLIFGCLGLPRLGIAGAALGTVISSAVGAILFMGLFLFGRDRHAFGVWAARRLDVDLFRRMVRFGLPSGLHFMADFLGWSLFVIFVGRLGVRELGATNLAFQINSLIFVPMIGMSTATATLVGQRLGQSRPDLAARTTWSAFHLTFAYMFCFAILYLLMPQVFLAPFGARANPAEFTELSQMAAVMLVFVAIYSLFDGVNLIFSAALKGAGDTLFIMLTSAILGFGVMVLPTWWICRTPDGSVWLAWGFLTLFIVALAGCYLWRFLQGKWQHMRVTESFHAPLTAVTAVPDVPLAEAPVTEGERI